MIEKLWVLIGIDLSLGFVFRHACEEAMDADVKRRQEDGVTEPTRASCDAASPISVRQVISL